MLAVLYVTCGISSAGDNLKRLVMFWNVENFFDPFDDTLTADEDFTPEGFKHWTWDKFLSKRNSIAKAIISVKDAYGDYPSVVGFAEVENYMVLKQLTTETALSRLDYGIIHRESPDSRGIDVALIYRRKHFHPLQVKNFPVSTGSGRPTRDILYVKGILLRNFPENSLSDSPSTLRDASDTLEIYVVHFPSKYGGAVATGPLRDAAAIRLLEIIDSTGNASGRPSSGISAIFPSDSTESPLRSLVSEIPACYPPDNVQAEILNQRNILVMGDFNDSPTSSSLRLLTNWGLIYAGGHLLNRENIHPAQAKERRTPKLPADIGTIKFEGRWELIDHFLVSEALKHCRMSIYAPPMLLESDTKYLGNKPFRSFYGPRWNSGPSDHLPILLEL